MYADLHVHTDASDGLLALADLPGAAERAGLEAVAVTDHDRLHPDLETPVGRRDGVTVVAGIELRVAAPPGRVDLLGYGARRTDDLLDLVDRVQTDRVRRGGAIVDCLEDRLGVEIAVALEPGVGRPHIARAVAAHPALSYTVGEVFDDLIGADCPCYVSRDVPDFSESIPVLREACPLVGLAHPLRYATPEEALALCADLDAVERYYPYDTGVDRTPVDRAIRRYDLVATGGSDAHDKRLGLAGLDREAYEPVRARVE